MSGTAPLPVPFSVPFACPLCGAGDAELVKRFPDGVEVGRCRGCGLLYTPRRHPAPESVLGRHDAASLEERFGAIVRGEAPHHREDLFRWYLDRIERHRPPGRRLLDVGCAHGLFGAAARVRGYRVTGVEPNPGMAAFARQHGGIEVIEGTASSAELEGRTFDVVTLTDTLEYVPDPVDALARVADAMASGALLLLKVPNARQSLARLKAARALGRDPGGGEAFDPSTRVVHYTSETLRRLVERTGLRVIEEGHPPPVHAPLWHRRGGPWREHASPWRHAPVERTLRTGLWLAGRLEAALRGRSSLAPAIHLVARRGG